MQTIDKQPKMQASFTPDLLAENLGVDLPTLKRAMTRMNYYYGKDDALPMDVVREIVATYATPHPRRPEGVVESAQQFAQQYFNIQVNINNSTNNSNNSPNSRADKEPPAPEPEPVPVALHPAPQPSARQPEPKPAPKPLPEPPATDPEEPKDTRSPFVTILIYMAFIFILMFQMEHVASIGMDVSALSNETARQVSGWLFAFTFNLTALLMTLRRGISATIKFGEKKMSYILLFAILDVIFFVMSAAPMGGLGEGALMWMKSILVGSATAFVIYSFNELLTRQ